MKGDGKKSGLRKREESRKGRGKRGKVGEREERGPDWPSSKREEVSYQRWSLIRKDKDH